MHVRCMHQANYQLGCDCLTTLSQRPNSFVQDQLQVHFPTMSSHHGVISETICNLAIAILHDDSWNPNNLSAPNHYLVPEWILLYNCIPFGHGAELIANIPFNPCGMQDIYINNIINLTINISGTNHIAQGQAAALLTNDATAWPNHPEEFIPCKSMDTRDKLMAKAGLTKTQIILGWEFDFRCLQISLPENKYIAWMTNISTLLVQGTTTAKELKSMIE
jgi:hypothetical protein